MRLSIPDISRVNNYIRSVLKLEPSDIDIATLIGHAEQVEDPNAKVIISQLADNITYLLSLNTIKETTNDEAKMSELIASIRLLETATKNLMANMKQLQVNNHNQEVIINTLQTTLKREQELRKKYQTRIAKALKYQALSGDEIFENTFTTHMANILNGED